MRKCLQGCVGTTKPTELWCENWEDLETTEARGMAEVEGRCFLRSFLRLITGAGNGSRKDASGFKEEALPNTQENKTPSRARENGSPGPRGEKGRAFTGHSPLPTGSILPKSPSRSGFCLFWGSCYLTANCSRSEEWLVWASELWGKVANFQIRFFLLKTEEQQYPFKCSERGVPVEAR